MGSDADSWRWIASLISTVIFAVIGAFIGNKFAKKTIAYGTSLIGSYTFMRGWALIFEGFVGEQKMYGLMSNWDEVNLEWQMVVYIAILYLTFIVSAFYQFNVDESHDLMVNTVKSQGTELADM